MQLPSLGKNPSIVDEKVETFPLYNFLHLFVQGKKWAVEEMLKVDYEMYQIKGE